MPNHPQTCPVELSSPALLLRARAHSTMANVSLDSQTFFDPQSAGGKSANYSRNDGRTAASPRGQKRPEHDAQDHRRAATGSSPADGILISSESESDDSESGDSEPDDSKPDDSDHDDFGDGQSDTSFPLIDDILPTASAGDIHVKRQLVQAARNLGCRRLLQKV